MTETKSKYQAGGLSISPKTAGNTGNSATGRDGGGGTSAVGKQQSNSTLPKWLYTNPEILASQVEDLLALARLAGWFVVILPVTTDNGRTAITVAMSPPLDGPKIGTPDGKNITLDGLPVKDWIKNVT